MPSKQLFPGRSSPLSWRNLPAMGRAHLHSSSCPPRGDRASDTLMAANVSAWFLFHAVAAGRVQPLPHVCFLLHSRALSSTVSAAFTRFDFPTSVQQSALLFYSYFLSVCTGNAEQTKKKNPKPPLQQTQGLTLFVKELKNYHVPEGPSPRTESRHFFKAAQPQRSTEIKRQPTCPARP